MNLRCFRSRMILRRFGSGLLAALVLALSGTGAQAAWRWLGPSPESTNLTAVAFGGGLFVAVGEAGRILTSADGRTWTPRSSWAGNTLESVVYGPGGFVAVGGEQFRQSPDGIQWSVVPFSGFTPWANTVGWADGFYVAYAGLGSDEAYRSADGLAWERLTARAMAGGVIDTGRGTYRPVNGNQLVPVVGQPAPSGALFGEAGSLAYGNGRYVSLWMDSPEQGGESVMRLRHSADAVAWTILDLAVNAGEDPGVTYAGSRFFVTGGPGDTALTSADGLTWRKLALPAGFLLRDVAFGSGQYVAVGDYGSIARSADGLQWEIVLGGRSWGTVYGVAEGNGIRVAVGDQVQRSVDGRSWEPVALALRGALRAVTYGNGQFVAVGDEGMLLRSPDGLKWTSGLPYLYGWFRDVLYTGRQYVAVGDSGMVITSPDGGQWIRRSTGTANKLVAVASGQGVLVVVGERGSMLRSTDDGLTWAALQQPADRWLYGVAYGNGRFVASGLTRGQVPGGTSVTLVSADGLTWRQVGSELDPYGRVVFGGGQFLVGPSWGWVMLSTDGEQWRHYRDPHFVGFHGSDYLQGEFYLSGSGLVAGTVDAATCPFPDLGADPGLCAAVAELQARGVVSGFPGGTFRPAQPVTRAEVAKLLVGVAGATPEPGGALAFTDTRGHWAAQQGYLQAAVKLKLLAGFPDGSFQPNEPVTRGQLAKLLVSAAKVAEVSGRRLYRDLTETDWFAPWAEAAYNRRLIGPAAAVPLWTDPTFDGNRPATRGEVAAALYNWLAIRDYGY